MDNDESFRREQVSAISLIYFFIVKIIIKKLNNNK